MRLIKSRVHSREGGYPTNSTNLWKVFELRRWWKVCASPQGGAQAHKHVNHVNSDVERYTYRSSREMFYTKTVILRSTVMMNLTWNSLNYLTLQSEIQLFLEIVIFLCNFPERGHKSRSLKNLWQWKITFPNCRALRTSNTTW